MIPLHVQALSSAYAACRHSEERAAEKCKELSATFGMQLARVESELQAERETVRRMRAEREHYERSLKQAILRGLSALNLETLGIFDPAKYTDVEKHETQLDGSGGDDDALKVTTPPPPPRISQHISHALLPIFPF